MVLVMESDGSLTPSQSQNSFARNYNDGIGQTSAANELAIFGSDETGPEGEAMRFAARDVGFSVEIRDAELSSGNRRTCGHYRQHPSQS